ncbi:MAG: thioredoxin family protein [Chitinophagaceae bacterium]|nr:MAG: thioredoxin family protein [Chitinophagaceae bacterium]
MSVFKQRHIDQGLTYADYKNRVIELVSKNRTSGPNQSGALVKNTLKNIDRMKWGEENIELISSAEEFLDDLNVEWIWIVFSEAWSDDSSHILPAIKKVADYSDKIDLKILFREEYPVLFDNFLTDKSRSIPKLVCLRKSDFKVLGTWGPRPAHIQERALEYKANPDKELDEFIEEMEAAYKQDKGETTQQELIQNAKIWWKRS